MIMKTSLFNDNNTTLLNVPSTFLRLLGAEPLKETLPISYYKNALGAEKVLFFLLDGFGHNLYQTVALNHFFFKKVAEKGLYHPIATVFPSTTATAISTINSGLSPLEHGLPEWFIYFRELDAILESLPFKPIFEKDLDSVKNAPAEILFDQTTIYEYLAKVGVSSYVVMPEPLDKSFYNIQANRGATVLSYSAYSNLMVVLKKLLKEKKGKVYIYVYIASIDTAEHVFGPWSNETETEISLLSNLLENEFIKKLDKDISSKIALFISSDHGQVSTNPEKTFYLNTITGFDELLEQSPNGKPIFPTGNVRDVFLHIKSEKVNKAIILLKSSLPDDTKILKIEDCIKQDFFGNGKKHPEFISRVGNLLILPGGEDTVWYRYSPTRDYQFLGNHGGLSEDEMLIPFVSVKLSDL